MADGLDALRDRVGQELGVSDWLTITQDMVDAHADVTEDRDWLHNDVERARRDSPFGGPIAQGGLLVANLVRLQRRAIVLDGEFAYALNYGFDRVRFTAPVPVGSRIRGRFELRDVRRRGDDSAVLAFAVTIEVEGGDGPAMVAEWLAMVAG